MHELVALAIPPGPAFAEALVRTWDAGDAALPLDQRLPRPALDRLLDELAPTALLDEAGDLTRRSTGHRVEPGDALVVATSGTTGDPKGVVLTHDAVAASAEATSARLGIDPGHDRWLCCLPVAHVGGLGVVTRALHTKTPVEIHPRFDAAAVADAAGRGATRVSLVAAALARIDPRPFTTILLGGAADRSRRPANVVRTYGMTETGGGVVYDGEPLDGVDVRIVDGMIHVRCPMLGRAYRHAGDHDRDLAGPGGWFATGDAGAFDADGRLVIHGRIGDLIITGGQNVWPAAVEAVIQRHPAVREVMVTGRPDPEWGQAVTAIVVPSDPADPPVLPQLRDHVRGALPAYCAPRGVEIVEALPRAAGGKVRRIPGSTER